MTTKNGGAASKKGPPARPTSDAERAILRSFAQQQRTLLTRDVFLRSQGPPVVEVNLGNLGVTVLMRRIDLLDLARRGTDYYPFRSAIYGMIREGGLSQAQLAVESLQDTLDLAARVALDTIVVSPPEYVQAAADDDAAYAPMVDAWLAEIEEATTAGDKARADTLRLSPPTRPTTRTAPVLAAMRAADLRPLFVEAGEEPDADQVVLRYALPDDDGVIAEGDGEGGIPPADLVTILRAAHQYGPGALGRRFRGDEPEAPALGALRDLAGGGPKPSRQLGITYPWVAVDLDTAAHALGKHVEAEVDKRRRAEEKAINNEPAISVGKKGKGRAARKYRQLPDERRREIWFEVVARIVDEKVVLHDAPPKGETGRWRWEKPITGDSQLDQQQHKGARTVYDAEGRRRAEFDASGKRTYLWNPG